MKRLIQTFACLGLALGCPSQPVLSQAQDDAPAAASDLGPVLERLDQVIAGLARVSSDLAKLQKASSGNANNQAATAAKATDLLEQLVALQTAAAARARQPAARPKWEYKSIFGDSRVALEEEMNLFGKDGWEFFNIASFGRGTAAFARRPVK